MFVEASGAGLTSVMLLLLLLLMLLVFVVCGVLACAVTLEFFVCVIVLVDTALALVAATADVTTVDDCTLPPDTE